MAYRIDRDPLIKHHGFTVGTAWQCGIVDGGDTDDRPNEVERDCIVVHVYRRNLRVASAYTDSPRSAYRKAWMLAKALAKDTQKQRKARRSA